MARASRTKLSACGLSRTVFAVRFWANGTSDPATIYGEGIDSVTFASTGKWLVTFTEAVRKVVGASVGIGLATPNVAHEESVIFDNEGTTSPLTATISYGVAGTLTNIAADADNWVSLIVQAEQSSAR